MARFHLENFTVIRYGERLFSASLSYEGEGFCLLGGHRSGKTPFCLGLCGTERTEGEFSLNGESLQALPAKERNCGALFGARTLFRGTIRENIAYGMLVRGVERSLALKRAEEEAALFGITALLDTPAKKCDFLTAQKVAFLRLTARNPRYIVLDFPVRGDSREELQFLADARKIAANKGIFLILLTESARQAALFDTVGVLSQGKIEAFAKRSDLLDFPPSLAAGKALFQPYNQLYGAARGGVCTVADQPLTPCNFSGEAIVFCYENAFTVGGKGEYSLPVRVDFWEEVSEGELAIYTEEFPSFAKKGEMENPEGLLFGTLGANAPLYRYYLDLDLSGEETDGKVTRFTALSTRIPQKGEEVLSVLPHAERIHPFLYQPSGDPSRPACKKRKKSRSKNL